MARALREAFPGVYHVTTRGAGPCAVFHDDDDRTRFCNLLVTTLVEESWVCRGFCFMTTHYHLLLDVPDESLPAGMQRLNGLYARGFNLRHKRTGHLFGGRYYSDRADTDKYMLELLRYVARNPVRAGACRRPADWYWSSYRGCLGLDSEFPFVDSTPLLAYFGSSKDIARTRLREFVEAKDADKFAPARCPDGT
jgi:REP element-mobilizing transposase RayT